VELDRNGESRFAERPSVIGSLGTRVLGSFEDRDSLGEAVQHKDVNVRHGSFGNGGIEALGQGGSLERECSQAVLLEKSQGTPRGLEL
jgi:hypothetical protein